MRKSNTPKGFEPYRIRIKTADGRTHTVNGYYDDIRLTALQREEYKEYNIYEFRESDNGRKYHATVEERVMVNHSGTFLTKAVLPFNTDGNADYFQLLQ